MNDLRDAIIGLNKRIAAIERVCGIIAREKPDEVGAEDIITLSRAFPAWSDSQSYTAGSIVGYNGKIYKCLQDHRSNTAWTPISSLSLWEVIEPSHAGTAADPIPAAVGMRYFRDLYYSEGNAVYRCVREDVEGGTLLYYLPSQLVGDYFTRA